jgi:hypothetical protein
MYQNGVSAGERDLDLAQLHHTDQEIMNGRDIDEVELHREMEFANGSGVALDPRRALYIWKCPTKC